MIKCNCCARQIVSKPNINDNYCISSYPRVYRDIKGFICFECGEDLDINGNFPNES